jgi:hypothetical protein
VCASAQEGSLLVIDHSHSPKHFSQNAFGLFAFKFNKSSILAIHRTRKTANTLFYRIEYSIEGLSSVVDSCFDPHTQAANVSPLPLSRRAWIPAFTLELACPEIVEAYKTQPKVR